MTDVNRSPAKSSVHPVHQSHRVINDYDDRDQFWNYQITFCDVKFHLNNCEKLLPKLLLYLLQKKLHSWIWIF